MTKTQMNSRVPTQIRRLYDVAETHGGFDKSRLVAAGLLMIFERPGLRQEALDSLSKFESRDVTDEELIAIVRGIRPQKQQSAAADPLGPDDADRILDEALAKDDPKSRRKRSSGQKAG